MYVLDLLSSFVKKRNIPILIYFALNIAIITLVLCGIQYITDSYVSLFFCIFLAIIIYLFSIWLSLTPLGEWYVRIRHGCKKIKRQEIKEYLDPIFLEVYSRAKRQHPEISDNITIYIQSKEERDESPSAFALGRNTICINHSMLSQPVDQIKAVLGHEFAHIAHHDTDIILIIEIGNIFISTVLFFLSIFSFHAAFSSDNRRDKDGSGIFSLIALFIFSVSTLFNCVWTLIGTILF